MSLTIKRFTEYDATCDICGVSEVLHNIDVCDGEKVNSHNFLRIAGFHRYKNLILCDKCFKNRKEVSL